MTILKRILTLKTVAQKAKQPNVQHELCKKIVITLLRKDAKINWAKEIKIAKQLMIKFPELSNWNGIPEANRVNSLAFFLTSDGKKFIEKYERMRNYEPELAQIPTIQPVGSEIYGENKVIYHKPKTLMEFLKYGKEG